ncbi:MAG: tetratricopeptide repeat protein [Acidobacteria bacterium]|nr:tetratricopeptide repeat protein [Acidobacteriota bacterium]MBV9475530.1 tetratricopeptide repeat protein [Acidobacteriota bacterium]
MIRMLIEVTLLAGIGRLVMLAMPRASAALRAAIAIATLAGMLVIPLVNAADVTWRLPLRNAPVATVMVDRSPTEAPVAQVAPVAQTVQAAPPMTLATREAEPLPAPPRNWLLWIAVVVAGCALLHVAFGAIAVSALARSADVVDEPLVVDAVARAARLLGIRRAIRVVASDRVPLPSLWGFRKPVLLLPRVALAWPAERLEAVLLHELAHAKRHDVAALLFARVVRSLFWFHPLAWSLERAARRDCERACDDLVLRSGCAASAYADHLLAIARTLQLADGLSAAVAMSRPSELGERVAAILQPQRSRKSISWRTWTAVAAMTCALAIPLATVQLVAKPAPTRQVTATQTRWSIETVLDRTDDARTAFREARYADAIRLYREVLAAQPDDATTRYNLACAYARHGDRQLALATLRDAVYSGYTNAEHMLADDDLASIRGSEMDALAALAPELVLSDRGGWAAAARRYEVFANRHPELPRAWFNLGFALVRSGEERRAIDAFTRVRNMGYRRPTAAYNIGCAFAKLGDSSSALQWLHRAEDEGFDVGAQAAMDDDVDTLRTDPWLASLITARRAKLEKKHDKEKSEKDKEKEKSE